VFTDGFQSFLNRQRELMRLDRVVIDECHVMLNESGILMSSRGTFICLNNRVSSHGGNVAVKNTICTPRVDAVGPGRDR
jgi:3-dehydroquinate synthase class II